jgi:hypothetical protein
MPRFGFADYAPTAPNVFGQMRYLQAVSSCVPQAIDELMALNLEDYSGFAAWAKHRGFTDAWASSVALKHQTLWSENPHLQGKWLVVTGCAWEPVPPPFPAWNLGAESEAALRERFERYIETCKSSSGITPTPNKNSTFEWLAHHHVGRLTYSQIKDRFPLQGLDSGQISREIKSTSELIGLTLRPKPGRKLRSI